MPVVITFDLKGALPTEQNRIQSFFERFGWENLGGSSYRYPRLGTDDQPVEDWLNHVIPALMLFRSYAIASGKLTKYTLDVNTSTGYSPKSSYGSPAVSGAQADLYETDQRKFGEQKLRDWLDGVKFPYP